MDSETQQPSSEDVQLLSFDVRRYIEALRKYAWAVLAMQALAITLAVVYTRRQPKIYQAVASVQIEPRLPDLIGAGQDLLHAGSVGTLDYYAQQKEVLGSYT